VGEGANRTRGVFAESGISYDARSYRRPIGHRGRRIYSGHRNHIPLGERQKVQHDDVDQGHKHEQGEERTEAGLLENEPVGNDDDDRNEKAEEAKKQQEKQPVRVIQ